MPNPAAAPSTLGIALVMLVIAANGAAGRPLLQAPPTGVVAAPPTAATTQPAEVVEPRVLGGTFSGPGFIAALMKDNNPSCGGALIAPNVSDGRRRRRRSSPGHQIAPPASPQIRPVRPPAPPPARPVAPRTSTRPPCPLLPARRLC